MDRVLLGLLVMNNRWASMRRCASNGRGVSLLEVIVAMGLLSGAIAALAQLFTFATRANLDARASTVSVVLATGKMEQLRGQPGVDRAPSGGSLQADLPGYSDFFDGLGRPLPAGTTRPAATAFVRRWSIDPLPSDPQQSRVLWVRVWRVSSADSVEPRWPASRSGESRLLTVVTGTDR